MLIIREATIADIDQLQVVRNLVTENTLSDPAQVTNADCEAYLTERGKGWVCHVHGNLAGFSIVSVKDNNVWALFVHPMHQQKGIGKQLHDVMLNWYFSQTNTTLWLGTEPDTRAEKFYQMQGWEKVGINGGKEVKFEMTAANWEKFAL